MREYVSCLLIALVAVLLASAPAEAQTCAHDICEAGDSLNPFCDPCVNQICQSNTDPFCCDSNGNWDENCVDEVLSVCGDPICAQECNHNPCEVGEYLDASCNPCVASICAQDPSCCTDDGDPLTDDWDASCVLKIQDNTDKCGYKCEPGADECGDALPITPGKFFGTLLGSSPDGCESGNNSCQSGSVWYEYTQGPADGMMLMTCATQRSFGIDTVLSVHEGTTVAERCTQSPSQNEALENDDHLLGLLPLACQNDPQPTNLDSALPLSGFYALDPGETVVIRIAHHTDSTRNPFEFRLLPESTATPTPTPTATPTPGADCLCEVQNINPNQVNLKNVATGGAFSSKTKKVVLIIHAVDAPGATCDPGEVSDPTRINLKMVDDDGHILIDSAKIIAAVPPPKPEFSLGRITSTGSASGTTDYVESTRIKCFK